MKFWVDEPPQGMSGVHSGPLSVCHNEHEECSDYRGGPCSMIPCTCETDGRCLSCVRENGREAAL